MAGRYSELGLTVPVQEALDPVLWRERMGFGLPAGQDPDGPSEVSPLVAAACAAAGVSVETVTRALGQTLGALPSATIRWHLRAALSELEVKLGVPMGVQIVKGYPVDEGLVKGRDYDRVQQRLPYLRSEMGNWWRIDLPDSSVISIERIRSYWFGQLRWQFVNDGPNDNNSLIVNEWGTNGVAHVLPINLQGIVITAGDGRSGAVEQYGLWETINLYSSTIPDFWSVDYTVGPVSKSGEPMHLEAVLVQWVYAVAGRTLLSLSGLQQSKGLTSASVSMDGVSRSVGLQASAIYGINSALEKVLEDLEKRIDWSKLRAYKRGLTVYGFGH